MIRSSLIVFTLLIAGNAAAQTDGGSQSGIFGNSNTRFLADIRLRYEGAEFESAAETADSLTLRARLGIETALSSKTGFLVEGDFVQDFVGDFNDTINGKSQFPVIADPDTTEVNRLQIVNTSLENSVITVGRQRIILGDSRFVGNVGWRQNEQTYDALRITSTPRDRWAFDATYVNQVNRIFGSDSPNQELDSSSWLLNATYDVPVEGATAKVTGHVYLLDFDNAAVLSSQTVGVTAYLGKDGYNAKLGFSRQSDYGNQPVNYSENYTLIELSKSFGKLSGVIGRETLAGDGTRAFSTPLATLHKFNGFVDNFLATPVDGLEDTYITTKYGFKVPAFPGPINVSVTFHDFQAENTSADYGRELDFVAVTQWGKFQYLFKMSSFQADTFATDRLRYSFHVGYNY